MFSSAIPHPATCAPAVESALLLPRIQRKTPPTAMTVNTKRASAAIAGLTFRFTGPADGGFCTGSDRRCTVELETGRDGATEVAETLPGGTAVDDESVLDTERGGLTTERDDDGLGGTAGKAICWPGWGNG